MSGEPIEQARIGVSMRVVQAWGYEEPRDALAHDWGRLMRAFLPEARWLPLPNLGADVIVDYCRNWGVNRVILTGGNDIGEALIREETERALLELAAERHWPLLGICRGMQLMAQWQGTELRVVTGHVRTRHKLRGRYLHEVNSFHDYGLSECPESYEVLATSEDGEIEAIRHKELPWEGWMWHPEREAELTEVDRKRMRKMLL